MIKRAKRRLLILLGWSNGNSFTRPDLDPLGLKGRNEPPAMTGNFGAKLMGR